MRRPRKPPPELALTDPHALVPLKHVVPLIAERVKNPGDSDRQVEDRVRHRINYAVGNGTLAKPQGGTFVLGEVIAWASAQRGWEDKMLGLPTIIVGSSNAVLEPIAATGIGMGLPTSLAECHARLIQASVRLVALENELREIRPLAKRYEENREKQRKAGNTKKSKM